MNKIHPSREVQGFFLSFSPQEIKEIIETLEQFEYDPGPDGLKKWILDTMKEAVDCPEPSSDRVVRKVSEFVKANPEQVDAYLRICTGILGKVMQKKKAG